MKLTKIHFAIGTLVVVGLVALLRFQPWACSGHCATAQQSMMGEQNLSIGYLPVTCHLTCPVTDFASKTTQSKTNFSSLQFSDFPTVASALEAKQIMATFMIAPLAMKLREEGVPIKICYLGHRDGSQIVVAKNSTAKSLKDLVGKTMALPSRYSNQNLVIHKLMNDQGIKSDEINFVELPPGEMPTSLAAGAIDAYFVGEPFCAKSEMDGIGRVLYYAKDIWPNFISCALVVHEDLIKSKPDVVRDLVRGIAESGLWAETHRADAAKLVAPYYRQNEKLLNYVLTSNPHRVSYVNLTPTDEEITKIADMALQMNLIRKKISVSALVDRSFIPETINVSEIDIDRKQ